MKLYVLEERAPSQQEAPPSPVRRRSRVVVTGGAIAVLLGVGGVGLERLRSPIAEGSGAAVAQLPVAVIAATATASTAPGAARAAALEPSVHVAPSGVVDTGAAPAEQSSVVRKGGKFVVDLHAVDVGSALAMMSQATRTRVVGADALRNHPARLTAKLTATSPQSAWQSVFGDIANFAVSCVGEACVVHIVSAVGAGELQVHAPVTDKVSVTAIAPVDGVQPPSSIAASVAAVQQQQTTYTDDY